ncbi:MAG: DNA translocase FtsK [Eubacteriales bacterium]|nr:DNA translocase FtsK [Eubacteriales bacterium]
MASTKKTSSSRNAGVQARRGKETSVRSKKSVSTTKKSGTSVKKGTATGKRTSDAAKRRQRELDIPDISRKPKTPLGAEVMLWLMLAFCVILFLSNLGGIGGSIGNAVSRFFFGLFGIAAYLLPFFLFLSTAFLVANRGSVQAWAKVASAILLLICLSTFCELAVNAFESSNTFTDYYRVGSELRSGGGIAGGLLCKFFCPIFGKIGAWLLTAALLLICVIVLTEQSMIDQIRDSRQNAYGSSDMRRELHQLKKRNHQLERQRRMQDRIERTRSANEGLQLQMQGEGPRRARRVSGVSADTTLDTGVQTAGDIHEVVPSLKHTAAVSSEEEPMSRAKRARMQRQVESPTKQEHLKKLSGENMSHRIVEAVKEEDATKQPDMSFTIYRDGATEQVTTAAAQNTEAPYEAQASSDTPPFETEEEPLIIRRASVTARKRESVKPTDTDAPIGRSEETTAPMREAIPEERTEPIERTESTEPTERGPIRNPRSSKEEQEEALNSVAQEIEAAQAEQKPTYVFPPIDLLKKAKFGNVSNNNEVRETAVKLQQTLHSFGVNVTVTNVSCGPAVTRYELTPEQGVKVSRIVNLADDIKLNLAASDIRIEAPIPGKSAVGIEVPNKENSAVPLRELIESDEFQKAESKLSFAVGKDIAGKVVVADIAKMPHLLIAGATGSGKSVCINTLIMSILYKADPEEVKLIMIDPKVVELSVYNGIPHLFIPVVTDPKKASGALNWGVAEMTDRYAKFAECGVRDLKGYNAKIPVLAEAWERQNEAAGGTMNPKTKPQKLPQIIIIVDELADLMMVAPGEVEDAICRLAQLARAAGIHLIIATQRPSVNVITGLIKANMPSRVAFSVTSGVDSRTILDMQGAEKLLGKGDMLFYPQGYQKPARVQGALVTDDEVSAVTEFLTNKNDVSVYQKDMEERIGQVSQAVGLSAAGGGGASDIDAKFAEAGKFIIDKDKASIGMLQRVFKIGFNRAARIMDQLSDAGVVGPEEGTKPRKVLMSMEQFEQYIEEHL